MSHRSEWGRRGFLFASLAGLAAPLFAQCRETPADALGPFYVAVDGISTDLCRRDRSSGIIVSGRITAVPECLPIADALIEIWHANKDGAYSRTGDARGDDAACLLRGNVRSDEGGRYSFRTLAPGVYPSRPRHIHLRIAAPRFRTLVTQIYFPPQDGIDPRLLAKPVKTAAGGAAAFEFDIGLAPA